MAGKRERNKQANRAAILAAARACFVERGYDAVAVRDIVRRTDLAAGTFYNYFPDKESVFRALLEERINTLTDRLTRLRRGARTLRAFIYEAYLAAFEAAADDPLFYEVILRNSPQVRELYEDSVMGISVAALEADIRDAIDRSLLPEIDVEYLAAAFFGVGFEMGRCLARREDRDPRPAAALATRLFLEGIGGAARADDADAA